MDSAQRSLYKSVWKRPVAEIKSAVGKNQYEDWRWCGESKESESGYTYDAGGNVIKGMLMRNGEVKWVRLIEYRNHQRTPQEFGLHYQDGVDQTWLRRWEDEEEDYKCHSHVQHSRQQHFSRKMNDKKVLKKKKRSAWINRKASKKRRK